MQKIPTYNLKVVMTILIKNNQLFINYLVL